MTKPRIFVLSLDGTITMPPGGGAGGIAQKLAAAELVAAVPALADVAKVEAHFPFRLPSPLLSPANLVKAARRIEEAFAQGFAGAVVVQGTDTIEESAFLLDLLVDSEQPVVVTGAMHVADAPGADGPANLLAAVRTAAAEQARGLGTLVVLNYDIHAARFVQKSHTAQPSAFASPLVGPIGAVVEGCPRLYVHPPRLPGQPSYGGPPRPVALLRWAMGEDGRLIEALPSLGYAGAVIEGMSAGHVPAGAASLLGELAARMPVVLATRCMAGPDFTGTYDCAGGEIDLIGRGLIPAGILSSLKARLLLGLALRNAGGQASVAAAFAPYQ